jgi:predicted secreted Zn-dependent protease
MRVDNLIDRFYLGHRSTQISQIFCIFLLLFATLLLFTPACTSGGASALAKGSEPDIVISYSYYEITGTTANDLRAQMDRLGPVSRFNSRHDGYTDWYVNWSYPYSTTNSSCTAGPIGVKVTITFIFPKWEAPSETPKGLVEDWTNYLNALQTHEHGHKAVAIEAGREILRSLKALPAYRSCEELEQAADITGQQILIGFRQKENDYDRDTAHGITQGVQFPYGITR